MSKALLAVVLTGAMAVLGARKAGAVGEGERQLSGLVGFALAEDGAARPGVQGAVEGALGLSEAWAARATFSVSLHPASGSQPHRQFSALTLGFTYAFDVLRLVPFVDLGLTVADVRTGGADSRQRLGPQGGLGLEYLLSRRWAVAALARAEYLGLRLGGASEPQPWLVIAGVRLGWIF